VHRNIVPVKMAPSVLLHLTDRTFAFAYKVLLILIQYKHEKYCHFFHLFYKLDM